MCVRLFCCCAKKQPKKTEINPLLEPKKKHWWSRKPRSVLTKSGIERYEAFLMGFEDVSLK